MCYQEYWVQWCKLLITFWNIRESKGVFLSGVPCFFLLKNLLLVGRWAAAEEMSMGVCQQCSNKALHRHTAFCCATAWPEGRALLVALHLGRCFSEKNLKWNTYNGSSILALLKFHILSSWCWLFSLYFLFPVTCMLRKDYSLKEWGFCW